MIIGIDFDNTLVNTKEVAKKYLDVYLPNNHLNSYHDLPYEKEVDFFQKYNIKITNDLKLYPDVLKAFSFFKKNNIKVILITARGYDNERQIIATKKFLKGNNLLFDKYIFCAKSKEDICKKEKVDLMIDDTDDVLEKIKNQNIKVLKYGSKSTKYKYVLTWQEVINYIRKEANIDENS